MSTAPLDTVRLGDSRVDGSSMEGFRVVWTLRRYSAGGVGGASNEVHERLERDETPEGLMLTFSQMWYDSLGALLFTSVRRAEASTMRYRTFHTVGQDAGFGHLDINGRHVTGARASGTGEHMTLLGAFVEEEPFASFAGLLFGAFRLEDGWEGVFPGFGWGGENPSIVWQRFKVTGLERVSSPALGNISAWRVETSRSPGSRLVYLVTDRAPYFVGGSATAPNGAETRFELKSFEPIG